MTLFGSVRVSRVVDVRRTILPHGRRRRRPKWLLLFLLRLFLRLPLDYFGCCGVQMRVCLCPPRDNEDHRYGYHHHHSFNGVQLPPIPSPSQRSLHPFSITPLSRRWRRRSLHHHQYARRYQSFDIAVFQHPHEQRQRKSSNNHHPLDDDDRNPLIRPWWPPPNEMKKRLCWKP